MDGRVWHRWSPPTSLWIILIMMIHCRLEPQSCQQETVLRESWVAFNGGSVVSMISLYEYITVSLWLLYIYIYIMWQRSYYNVTLNVYLVNVVYYYICYMLHVIFSSTYIHIYMKSNNVLKNVYYITCTIKWQWLATIYNTMYLIIFSFNIISFLYYVLYI